MVHASPDVVSGRFAHANLDLVSWWTVLSHYVQYLESFVSNAQQGI